MTYEPIETPETLEETLTTMVRHLVSTTCEIKIAHTPTTMLIEITPHLKDAGKLVGTKGNVINGIRNYAKAAGARYKQHVIINLDIPDKP